MDWGHWGAGGGPWPFHFFCLVVLGLLIWGAIYWFNRRGRRLGSSPSRMSHNEPDRTGGLDAMEVLRQRYARGEIDAATFAQMREQLGSSD